MHIINLSFITVRPNGCINLKHIAILLVGRRREAGGVGVEEEVRGGTKSWLHCGGLGRVALRKQAEGKKNLSII